MIATSVGFVTVSEHRQGPFAGTPNLWMNGEKGRLQTGGFHIAMRAGLSWHF